MKWNIKELNESYMIGDSCFYEEAIRQLNEEEETRETQRQIDLLSTLNKLSWFVVEGEIEGTELGETVMDVYYNYKRRGIKSLVLEEVFGEETLKQIYEFDEEEEE